MLELSRFDFDTYRAIIAVLRERHAILGYAEAAASDGQWCILRHDIDYSPESALAMAAVERELGVKSTYFLLMNSPFYNLLEPEYATFPRALADLGHEVGLHYDGAVLEEQAKAGDAGALIDGYAGLLSAMSGQAVNCVSMHNPAVFSGQDPMAAHGKFINAYDPAFTDNVSYISDSCGAWRDNAHDMLTGGDLPPRIHFLVHPIFWGAWHRDRWQCMEEALRHGDHTARDLAKYYASYWSTHDGVLQHDRRGKTRD